MLTYQEIMNKVTDDTVDFIKSETSKFNIDAAMIMHIISNTITDINYHSVIRILSDQRDFNAYLVEKEQKQQQQNDDIIQQEDISNQM